MEHGQNYIMHNALILLQLLLLLLHCRTTHVTFYATTVVCGVKLDKKVVLN